MPNKGKFIGSQDNLFVPDAPTIGATSGALDGEVTVAFTAPSDVGNDAITLYGASVFLAGATINYKVSVGTGTLSTGGSGNVYFIDGIPTKTLSLIKGFTYVFDLSDSSNSGHPFAFKDGSGSSYTSGVTTSGTAGNASATVTLVLATDASEPSRYYCTSHGNGMGNTISLIEASASTDPLGAAQAGATNSSSPITVTGLSNGTSYIAQVWAINDYGNGPLSAATSSFTPISASRGLFMGGLNSSSHVNNVDQIVVETAGNATDFGDLSSTRYLGVGFSSDTRAIIAGGADSSGKNIIEYFTFSSAGNATDFGDQSAVSYGGAGFSNNVRGVFNLGFQGSSVSNIIEYVTIASTGNSIDFGDLASATAYMAGLSSSTRGVFGGGYTSNFTSSIMYIDIASQGNSNEFGGLTVARQYPAGASNNTRGIFFAGSGSSYLNTIDYVTIASVGNATDFGDATASADGYAGVENTTKGVFGGRRQNSGRNNNIDQITIASTGDATDFGDMTGIRVFATGACSGTESVQNEDYFAPAAMGFFAGGDWSNTRDPSGNVSDTSHIEQSLITYIDIATTGRIAFFGDLIEPLDQLHGGFASSTRGGTMGGLDSAAGYVDTIQFVTFSTKGKASDFGNLSAARSEVDSSSNSTRGLGFGGNKQGLAYANEIEYITIASAGNSTDFGDLVATNYAGRSTSSTTRSILGGNTTSGQQNVIQYVTIASTGNAQDFGDLTVGRYNLSAVSSNTRGVFAGGISASATEVTMDYVTIASIGNATDFGDLTQNGYNLPAVSSSIRGVFGLRGRDADTNVMDYITIASTGNATDWGDWWKDFTNEDGGAGFSNSHGGLA